MAAVGVVGVEEVCQGCGALVVGGVGPQVGPFLQQGAVVPLDLSIGLRAVGPGALVADTGGGQCLAPGA